MCSFLSKSNLSDAKISFSGQERVLWVKRSKFWREVAMCFVHIYADIQLFGYVDRFLLKMS